MKTDKKRTRAAELSDEALYHRAEQLLASNRVVEGRELLEAQAKANSKYWEVYNDLGALAFAEQRHEQAVTYFERAVALEPKPGLATTNFASLLKLLGDRNRSVSHYARRLAVEPSDGSALEGIGALLASAGAHAKTPAAVQSAAERGVTPRYEPRCPSPDTIAGVFGGSWKSRLPGSSHSEGAAMFDDRRPEWLASQIDRGLHFKSVLELGPFEGYQTYLLDRLGAREIVSVEGNSINFLKCLCIKELYGLKARLEFGDVVEYMAHCTRRFDVVFASGVLYHTQDPVRFVELAQALAPTLYIWTHFFDRGVLSLRNGQERHFVPHQDRSVTTAGRTMRLHARSYLMNSYHDNIPSYWEGGQEDLTYWLEKDDLLWLVGQNGMEVKAIQGEGDVNGLPCISLVAQKSDVSTELS